MRQMQQRSLSLEQEASSQAQLLREYALLMILSNSNAPNLRDELTKAGVEFLYAYFTVMALMPASGQAITQENMNVLIHNLPDIAESGEALFAVENSRTSHILAIICNTEDAEGAGRIKARLYTFLRQIPRSFLVAVGPTTDLLGISSSFLAAQSSLNEIAAAQTNARSQANPYEDESQLISQLVSQIECADCQNAMATLKGCMDIIQRNPSELISRYHIMNLSCSVQRLCEQTKYPLSDAQLSMMLPSNHIQSVHYTLLQLIPLLCAHIGQKNEEAIQPTNQLVMNYLNRHFADYDISVQKVAEELGIGINRTYAIIREQTGGSFKTALTQLRIEHAKKLLHDSALSVSDISMQVGYGSASYFIKVFKATVGQPPDAYRRTLVSDSSDPSSAENSIA